MYFKTGEPETEQITGSFKFGLIVLSAIIILIGVLPQVLFNWLYF